MKIEDSFTLSVSPPRAASILLDADTVARCLPGLREIEETEPDRYEATLGLEVGPVKPLFKGWLQVDRSESPRRLEARAEGTDRATGSVAQIEFTADLEEEGNERTRVDVIANVRIRGRLGQYGTGVIRSAAKEVMRQFSTCLDSSLTQDVMEARTRSSGRSVLLIAWAMIRDFFRGLFRPSRGGSE